MKLRRGRSPDQIPDREGASIEAIVGLITPDRDRTRRA